MKAPAKQSDPLQVTVLVLPDSSMMTVACVVDPMRAANRVAGRTLFDWRIATADGGPVTLTCGLPLAAHARLGGDMAGDLLIVVSGFHQQTHAQARLVALVGRLARRFGQVAGIEAGSWILARAGLLDGKRATTHWEDLEDFAAAFPEIEVRADRFVADGKVVTAGGASPAFDLILDLTRRHFGHDIAMNAASVFIYEEAHAAGDAQPLVSLGRLSALEPQVARAIQLMEASLDRPVTVAAIARRLGVSVRGLELKFSRTLGVGPAAYFSRLRLNAARRMVTDTALPLREISLRTGYSSLSAFSRSFARQTGMTASAMRRQARQTVGASI